VGEKKLKEEGSHLPVTNLAEALYRPLYLAKRVEDQLVKRFFEDGYSSASKEDPS